MLARRTIRRLGLALSLALLLGGCDVRDQQQEARDAATLNTSPLLVRPTAYSEAAFRPLLEFDPLNYLLPPRLVSYLPSGKLEASSFADLDGNGAPEVIHTSSFLNPGGDERLLQVQVIAYYTPTEGGGLSGWLPVWPSASRELLTPEPQPSDTPAPPTGTTAASATASRTASATASRTATLTATASRTSEVSSTAELSGTTATATATSTRTATPQPPTPYYTAIPTDTPTAEPTASPPMLVTASPFLPLTVAQRAVFGAVGIAEPLDYSVQGAKLLADGRAVFGLRWHTKADGKHHLKLWAWQNNDATALKFAGAGDLASATQIEIADPFADGHYTLTTSDDAGKLQAWRWDGQQFNLVK